MTVELHSVDAQNRASSLIQAPPSFNFQVKNKAFKRKVGLIKKLKNKMRISFKKVPTVNAGDRSLSIRNINNAEDEQLDEYCLLDDDESYNISGMFAPDGQLLYSNKPFKIDKNIRNQLINMLKNKDFSKSQAKSIITKKFKKCKSWKELQEFYDDIPEKEIFAKGYDSMKLLYQDLKNKLAHLIELGYKDENSHEKILDALDHATNQQELDNYIESIPKYEFYQKGYTSNKEIEAIKKVAYKKLLKLGYSSDEENINIEEIFNDSHNSKEDFLKAIDDIPHAKIYYKGYETMTDYEGIRKWCIRNYKERLGYSDKKATKEAIAKQNTHESRAEFMYYINGIHNKKDIDSLY